MGFRLRTHKRCVHTHVHVPVHSVAEEPRDHLHPADYAPTKHSTGKVLSTTCAWPDNASPRHMGPGNLQQQAIQSAVASRLHPTSSCDKSACIPAQLSHCNVSLARHAWSLCTRLSIATHQLVAAARVGHGHALWHCYCPACVPPVQPGLRGLPVVHMAQTPTPLNGRDHLRPRQPWPLLCHQPSVCSTMGEL